VSLSAGEHTITIYAREDGFLINQLLLSNTTRSLSGLQAPGQRKLLPPKITMGDLAGVHMTTIDGGKEVVLSATTTNEAAVSFTAVSGNTGVVTVSPVSDGKFTVTPAGAGSTTVTVTATAEDCEPVQKTFTVTVNVFAGLYYQPDASGTIVINAVDALLSEPYANHSNVCATPLYIGTDFAWVAVEEERSLQLTPVSTSVMPGTDGVDKWRWLDTSVSLLEGKAPSISFKVNAAEAGAYYFSFFSNSPSDNTDSFHVAVNGVYQFQTGAIGARWTYAAPVTLKAGENVLTIYGRESGTLLRQLMLSRIQPSGLSGWQAASELSGILQPPPEPPEPPTFDSEKAAYLPDADGTIVINAVDALVNEPYANHSNVSAKPAYSGTTFAWVAVEVGQSLQLTPVGTNAVPGTDGVTKWAWTDTTMSALEGKVPSISFKVNVAEAGNYYFSFFSNTPNENSDSFHVVVNGAYKFQTSSIGAKWTYCPTAVTLDAGENILTIYGRESGTLLRQLMLSKAQPSNLSGWQTPSELAEPPAFDSEKAAYLPGADGTVVINAVDALLGEPYANHSNVSAKPAYSGTTFAWAAVEGDTSIQLTPVGTNAVPGTDGVTKWAWTDTTVSALEGKVPSLSFKINVTEAGSYYFSYFSNTPNENSDSFHVVVNGAYKFYTASIGAKWTYCPTAVQLNAGDNILAIYARESGTLLRQLMFSKALPSGLSGWQTPSELAEPDGEP
ncbi:MAG: hypothetical protein LBL15_01615, partial [Oscillospiraceae bacterium]|nr:hypothetical protein [Oscillospiraceae bacterium]